MAAKHHHRPAPAAPTSRPAAPSPVQTPSAGLPGPSSPGPAGQEAIRHRAYQLWEAAGRPDGDGVTFWVEAERELTVR